MAIKKRSIFSFFHKKEILCYVWGNTEVQRCPKKKKKKKSAAEVDAFLCGANL